MPLITDVDHLLCDGPLTLEDKKRLLEEKLASATAEYNSSLAEFTSLVDGFDDPRRRFEELDVMKDASEDLKVPLTEHIKTLHLNEGSLAASGAVLEYDNAKARTMVLRKCVKARLQYESAQQSLKELPNEDYAAILAGLLDMRTSLQTLREVVPGCNVDSSEFEERRTIFLAWHSTALVMAVEQNDVTKVLEVNKTYDSLGCATEFEDVFAQALFNKHKKNVCVSTASLEDLLMSIRKYFAEEGFLFASCEPSLLAEIDRRELIKVLEDLDLTSVITASVSAADSPADYVASLPKMLTSTAFPDLPSAVQDLLDRSLSEKVLSSLKMPLSKVFASKTVMLVGGLDLTTPKNRRTRIQNISKTVHEMELFWDQMFRAITQLYEPQTVREILSEALMVGPREMLTKLRSWDFSHDSQNRNRSVEELMEVVEISGGILNTMSTFESVVLANEDSETSETPESLHVQRPFLKWNFKVCQAVVQSIRDDLQAKVVRTVENLKTQPVDARMSDLPAFSMSPSEDMTSVAQDVLHHLHRFAQYMDDNNTHTAFEYWTKKAVKDGEMTAWDSQYPLFKWIVEYCVLQMTNSYMTSVGDIKALESHVQRQIRVDAEYLFGAIVDQQVKPQPRFRDFLVQLGCTDLPDY